MSGSSPVMEDSTLGLDYSSKRCMSLASLDSDASTLSSDHHKVREKARDGPVAIDSHDWHLVWCTEGCFKKEGAAAMAQLSELATSLGGKLEPLKKAMRFHSWVTSMKRKAQYSIITDWREAQPCLQTISELAQEGAEPILLIALYEQVGKGNRVRKAKKWARAPPQLRGSTLDIRVNVVESLEEASELVKKFRGAIYYDSSPSEAAMSEKTGEALSELDRNYDVDNVVKVDQADKTDKANQADQVDQVDQLEQVDQLNMVDLAWIIRQLDKVDQADQMNTVDVDWFIRL